jgi:hypothetical protein
MKSNKIMDKERIIELMITKIGLDPGMRREWDEPC